ncbi:hypothetical protein B5X24_HaOG215406 [Helicoverpa armigera]|nr:hypothetical protein B5X24_HaOG215406 [Helicoverpa armigera]
MLSAVSSFKLQQYEVNQSSALKIIQFAQASKLKELIFAPRLRSGAILQDFRMQRDVAALSGGMCKYLPSAALSCNVDCLQLAHQ